MECELEKRSRIRGNTQLTYHRLSGMQKMQAAMGGKPLGPNGQPSPAQIEAMKVSYCSFSV